MFNPDIGINSDGATLIKIHLWSCENYRGLGYLDGGIEHKNEISIVSSKEMGEWIGKMGNGYDWIGFWQYGGISRCNRIYEIFVWKGKCKIWI